MVLGADFYAIGCKSSVAIKDLYSGATDGVLPGEPVLYIYNFWNNVWRSRELPNSPACGQGSLMAVRGTQLIVYGELADTLNTSAYADQQQSMSS